MRKLQAQKSVILPRSRLSLFETLGKTFATILADEIVQIQSNSKPQFSPHTVSASPEKHLHATLNYGRHQTHYGYLRYGQVSFLVHGILRESSSPPDQPVRLGI
jgi:hypothetical protein